MRNCHAVRRPFIDRPHARLGCGHCQYLSFPGERQLPRFGQTQSQRAPDALAAQVGAIHRRAGLLAPRLVEAAGVDAVEAEVVEERDQDRLCARVVGGDRQRDAMPGSFAP
jgi:hypothetical protein